MNCPLPHMCLLSHLGVLHTDVLLEWAQSCRILTDILSSRAEGSWLPGALLRAGRRDSRVPTRWLCMKQKKMELQRLVQADILTATDCPQALQSETASAVLSKYKIQTFNVHYKAASLNLLHLVSHQSFYKKTTASSE